MGYFGAMTRQTGIVFGGATTRPVRATPGIELSESRTAEPPTVPGNSAEPAALAQSRTPGYAIPEPRVRQTEIAATRVWEAPHLLSRPTQMLEANNGAATGVPEFVLDVDTAMPGVNPGNDRETPARPLSAALLPEPSPGKTGDQPETSREPRHPTMAEVRAWVAEPLKELSERHAMETVPLRPLPVPEISAREHIEPSREVYALEIGTIEIVLDAPPVPSPPPRAPVAAPAEQSGTQWNRASRHYLRF